MAIFGVRGKCETPEHDRRDFEIRYTVDFIPSFTYSILAVVNDCQVNATPTDMPGEDPKETVLEAIQGLTAQLGATGVASTVKSFLGALKGAQSREGISPHGQRSAWHTNRGLLG